MKQAVKTPRDHRLALPEILDWLVEDKLVAAEAANQLKKERRYFRGTLHPLVVVADQKWRQASPPHKHLSLEPLTQWLADTAPMADPPTPPLDIVVPAI